MQHTIEAVKALQVELENLKLQRMISNLSDDDDREAWAAVIGDVERWRVEVANFMDDVEMSYREKLRAQRRELRRLNSQIRYMRDGLKLNSGKVAADGTRN